MRQLLYTSVFVAVLAVLAWPVLAQHEAPDRPQHVHAHTPTPAEDDKETSQQPHGRHAPDAPHGHEMWMRPLAADWHLIGMGQGFPIVSVGAPARSELPINRTDYYLTQPAIMANVESTGSRWVFRTTLNLEAFTLDDGEVTFGGWGEGYIDSRHPHTFLHEAMLSLNLWEARGGAFSISAGRGFAPYGTDDPMARPVLKYPTNHHLSQILERWTINAIYLRQGWSIEGGLFGGDEPTDPWDVGNIAGFGRSWSARATRRFGEGVGPMAQWELSGSVGRVRETHGGHHETLTHLYNTAVRHAGRVGASNLYGLAEYSVGNTEGNRYFSALGESQLEAGRHQPYVRVEYSTRPEYRREGVPGTDRFFRYDHDDEPIGATRWLITSLGYGHRLSGYPASARPFIELQHFRVRPEHGGITPQALFGRSSFWSLSAGVRVFLGGEPMRMGTYGILDPMTVMHRQQMEAMQHSPAHHQH
jgi:hypothetical protein